MSMTEKLAYIKKLRHLTTEEIAQQSGVPLGTLNKIFSEDESIDSFLDRLKQRTENISKNIDRNDLAKAIANNTNMSKAEANKTIDQYMNLLENARMEAGKQIDKLEVTLKKAAQEWKEIKHEALVAADKATDAAARSALISFLAILSGAVLCCIAGAYGSRKTQERVDI